MSTLRMPFAVKVAFAASGVWLAGYELHLLVGLPFAGVLFNRYVHDGVLLLASALCGLRAWRGPAERLAWGLIAAALLSWTLGEIYYTAVLWTAQSIPVPSPADVGYLGVYPLAFSGLIVLLRARARQVSVTLWVDGLIAALVVGALGAAVVFEEVLRTVGGKPISVATNLAYPLGDLLLLGIVATAFSLRRWRPDRSGLLLGLGIVVFWAADGLYLVEVAQNTYTQGGFFDVGWWAGIVLIALAAWQRPTPMARRERRESVAAIFAPIGFALVALGLLVFATLQPLDKLAVGLATAALVAVMARLLITFRERVSVLRATRDEALTDALTGLGNRRRLMLDLDDLLDLRDGSFHLVLFDLDGFKRYNDRFGHPAGDSLLARLGGHFDTAVRPYGSAYRVGGDEFCAVITSTESKLESVLGGAVAALAEDGDGFAVAPSYGTVFVPAEARTLSEALTLADARLYEHKDSRRPAHHDETHSALLQALRERDPSLHRHLSEVAGLARGVCRKLGLGAEDVDEIVRAAELHDVGKMAIPETILDKPGKLNGDERAFMDRHTLLGERILAAAPALGSVARLVRSSHERFDGEGYPDRLQGEQIPLGSRIIFACDSFNAMTSDRPYARKKGVQDAIAEMKRCAGTQFDPDVVRALQSVLEDQTDADPSAGSAAEKPARGPLASV
jgi:diguanylate cyclase (GGDEF)-like protein